MNVGIEAIGVAVPSLTLDLADLAQARGVEPSKYTEGLGTLRMSVAPSDEDTVTLAVRAGHAALLQAGLTPADVGMCIVGTETAVDHSKPVSAYVHGLLGLPTTCRIFETKHACFGATAGLQNALDWIRAGSARGKKALIIASDIARYGIGTPGEPTQGAGAVAMVVGQDPRLVSLDHGLVGTYARDVWDFWRPLYSKDAIVDGKYSVGCYLDALEGAYRDYKSQARPGHLPAFSDRFAAIAYHVPYGKMAMKAHRHLRAQDGDTDHASIEASFAEKVAPSLALPREVGNIYTGSLYLALASLLSETASDLSSRSIGLFSYGSGSCAEFFSGTVMPGAQTIARAAGYRALLARQRVVSVEEYTEIMNARENVDARVAEDVGAIAGDPNAPRYLGVRDHRRIYI